MDSQTHSRTHTRNNSRVLNYRDSICSVNSMNLIEGTTQHFSHKKQESISAHVQRQRWDEFFEPQYSFGAFIHESIQPIDNQHEKKMDRLIDDGNSLLEPKPQKPSIDLLSPTVPNVNKPIKQSEKTPDSSALLHRLELLAKIRGTNKEKEDQDTEKETNEDWMKQIKEKAYQLQKETQADADSDSGSSSTLDPEKQQEEEKKSTKWRRSFLLFLLGFLCPLLWLVNSFNLPSYDNRQTSANRRIDLAWRRRSRVAFGTFLGVLAIILTVTFVLHPELAGYRKSKLAESS